MNLTMHRVNKKYKKYWKNILRKKHGKSFVKGLFENRTEQIQQNGNRLRISEGLFTGHYSFRLHLNKILTEAVHQVLCEYWLLRGK